MYSSPSGSKYSQMSLAQLGNLLDDPTLSSDELAKVQNEYVKKRAEELLGSGGNNAMTSPPSQRRAQAGASPDLAPPQLATVPAPIPATKTKKPAPGIAGRTTQGVGCLFILAAGLILLGAATSGSEGAGALAVVGIVLVIIGFALFSTGGRAR